MKITKKIHQGYQEFENAKKRGIDIPQMFGKYQYIYQSKKGEISLVLFLNYYGNNKDFWEIYCLKGNLFKDVERFDTQKEAEKRIKRISKKMVSNT